MLLVVLAEPQGYKTVEDFARLVYCLFDNAMLILLNPQGAAIQQGIPLLSKIALEKGKNFAVITKFSELLELFPVQEILVVGKKQEAVQPVDYSSKHVALVFSEHPTREIIKDKEVSVPVKEIGTPAPELTLSCLAAIHLYKLREACKE
ncbi:MAG: hypothetical protein GXO42_01745 [bacterium]|nr:hypothetical protein [bacterium]